MSASTARPTMLGNALDGFTNFDGGVFFFAPLSISVNAARTGSASGGFAAVTSDFDAPSAKRNRSRNAGFSAITSIDAITGNKPSALGFPISASANKINMTGQCQSFLRGSHWSHRSAKPKSAANVFLRSDTQHTVSHAVGWHAKISATKNERRSEKRRRTAGAQEPKSFWENWPNNARSTLYDSSVSGMYVVFVLGTK